MELKELILSEVKRLKLKQGYIWKFQTYNSFISKRSIPLYEFLCIMEELCNEKVFEKEQDYIINGNIIYRYRLTSDGEKLIWHNY